MPSPAAHRETIGPWQHTALFWKLLLVIAGLCTAVVVFLAFVLSNAYESLLERQLDERLDAVAAVVSEQFTDMWQAGPTEEGQAAVKRLGERLGVRITLIDPQGRVLADTYQADATAVREMESHRTRPEFVKAMAREDGTAVAQRISPSLGVPYRYAAVRRGPKDAAEGVVRTAMPAAPADAEVAGLRRWTWSLGGLAILGAMAVGYGVAAHLTDPLRTLADAASAIEAGDYQHRLPVLSSRRRDEIGVLAQALNAMATRLAQRDRQLSSSSQMQATVLDGMNECVLAVDRGEHILFANASAARALGFDGSAAAGLTLLEIVRSHELRDIAQRALRTRQHVAGGLTLRGKHRRVFDVLATPLPGTPAPGIVLVMRDVTELKKLEQMRQQFVSNVSHELKTPLSSIQAYTETLLNGALRDEEHCERFLRRIDEQSRRLHQLIQDMLSLARIESGQVELELSNLPVKRIVARCLADHELRATARQIAIENAVTDDELKIRGDEEALRQVLGNLIDNAVNYTPAGGRVAVSASVEGPFAVIEVSDTGPGIAPEHHARLFERFYRVDKARSQELGGTGLGLSIVKHLCQAMGGSVAVESQPGRGSKFLVRLPLVAS